MTDNEIEELLSDHVVYHSEFQADFLITVRSGGTLYGCYRQALRELSSRRASLLQSKISLESLDLDIEDLQTESSGWFVSSRKRKRILLELERKQLERKGLQKTILEMSRELGVFFAQASKLRQQICDECQVDTISSELKRRLDVEMWIHNLKVLAVIDRLECGRLRERTITFLQSLPAELRRPLADQILPASAVPELLNWFFTYEPQIPRNVEYWKPCIPEAEKRCHLEPFYPVREIENLVGSEFVA